MPTKPKDNIMSEAEIDAEIVRLDSCIRRDKKLAKESKPDEDGYSLKEMHQLSAKGFEFEKQVFLQAKQLPAVIAENKELKERRDKVLLMEKRRHIETYTNKQYAHGWNKALKEIQAILEGKDE